MSERPSAWQRVLHGAGNDLRRYVTRVLLAAKGGKLALRFAACGCGDKVTRRGGECFIAPRGCGHKLCPRCSRRRGGRYARRVMQWLGHEAHGDLFSMCLTQKVTPGESLADARKRMAPKQRAYMRWLVGRGLVGAMTTCHAKWSVRRSGWHYHVHILAELPPGSGSKLLLLWKWADIDPMCYVDYFGDQCRRVLAAGPAIAELREDGGDTDFWHESASAVARAVQYPVRDMAQGVTLGLLGGDEDAAMRCARELTVTTAGWKMYRAWKQWRKPCPAAKAPEEKVDAETGEASGGVGPAVQVGTVGRLWRAARAGDGLARECFKALEAGCRNRSDFAARFVKFCRLAWGTPETG